MKLFIVFVFIFLGAHNLVAQTCNLVLTGHVHSESIHENLPGATVELLEDGRVVKTNQTGDFVFNALCRRQYSLLITHVNYDTVRMNIEVKANMHMDVDLTMREQVLRDITVSSSRVLQRSGFKQELSGAILQRNKANGLADLLTNINGFSMLQTGNSISKPVIHGLHGNRILTINNGVRQEGQQWGNEHAPEIDPFVANRITVIKGVDELRFGSDAIGAVILIEPALLRQQPGYRAEINALYFGNNRQWTGAGIFEHQVKRIKGFAYRVQGTVKKAANLATPGYRLNNTAFEEKNFSLTAAYNKEHFNTELYYSRFDTKPGIFSGSHIGNLSDLLNAIAAARPSDVFLNKDSYSIGRPRQEVVHQLLKSKTNFDVKNHRFSISLGMQYNRRKEFDVVRSSSNTSPQIDLSLYTFSEEFIWEHPRKGAFSGMGGISAQQQQNTYGGRYLIPNYDAYTLGFFYLEKWKRQKWNLEAGFRIDQKKIQTTRLQSNGSVYENYDFRFQTYAASLNAGYTIKPGFIINSNIAFSERAPQVNELLTNGLHHGNATFEVGNINLQKEKAVNLSLSGTYAPLHSAASLDVHVYNNFIRDFIYQQPKPSEPVLTISGAFPKILYQSCDARLTGADISAKWNLANRIMFTGKYSVLRARNLDINDWLIWMPSDRLEESVSYLFKDNRFFKETALMLTCNQVMRQTRTPDEKNVKQDYKPAPGGYALFHISLNSKMQVGKKAVEFGFNCRNLLNKAYRDYLNSFRYFTDEAGRDIRISIRYIFEHSINK